MQPGRYTELFFLDDATALAAGHRMSRVPVRGLPAARRPLRAEGGRDRRALHGERIDASGFRRLHLANAYDLPDGAFVLLDGAPWLVLGRELRRWTPGGYTERRPRPSGDVTLITPPSLVDLLRRGWEPVVPLVHGAPRAVPPPRSSRD